jgi:hypothetical protein
VLLALLLLNLFVWSSHLPAAFASGPTKPNAAKALALGPTEKAALQGAHILLLLTPIYHLAYLPLIER